MYCKIATAADVILGSHALEVDVPAVELVLSHDELGGDSSLGKRFAVSRSSIYDDADNDIDAMRLALFYCWRDGEDFDRVELGKYSNSYTLRICQIDDRNSIQPLAHRPNGR